VNDSIAQINARYGRGAVMLASDAPAEGVDVVPTGIPELDAVLSVGGWARGRVHEVNGPPAATLAVGLRACSEAQARMIRSGVSGTAAYVDLAHVATVEDMTAAGIDPEHLLVAQPDSAEQTLEVAQGLVASGAVDLVVVDLGADAAAVDPDHGGLSARLMSSALRKLTASAARCNAVVLFLTRPQPPSHLTGESPQTGNALKFYASTRIQLREAASTDDGGEWQVHGPGEWENEDGPPDWWAVSNDAGIVAYFGTEARAWSYVEAQPPAFTAKVVKNKLAPPFKTSEPFALWLIERAS
jgi:recombination protein RecA